MIITIKGADFSGSNIGTLDTYLVSKSIGAGATHDIPNYVTKNAAVSWTITLSEGYTFGTYSITMGGATVTPTISSDGKTMTIAIAAVTGKVVISVATVNESTGEEGDMESTIVLAEGSSGYSVVGFVRPAGTISDSNSYRRTDYIDISSYGFKTITAATSPASVSVAPVVFFDSEKTLLSGYTPAEASTAIVEVTVEVPEGATYVMSSTLNNATLSDAKLVGNR